MDYRVTLRAARVNAGMSTTDVCKEMKIGNQTLTNMENGRLLPTTERLLRLAELYNTPVEIINCKVKDPYCLEAVINSNRIKQA